MWLIELIIKGVAAIISAIISDKRVEATETVIKEIENAQDANDVGVRTLDSVLSRLRRDAAQPAGTDRTDPPKPV